VGHRARGLVDPDYNNADLNPLVPSIDLDDTAPNDSIYILPANSGLLQGCGNFPDGLVTATYPNCTFGASSWTWMGFRDQGDAGQSRDPQGRYFHGISYGPTLQNMNNGGLDNLRITTASGAASVLWFNGGNYRVAANFGFGPVAGNETPGWLEGQRCEVLPVELLHFTASEIGGTVRLAWATASEHNSDHFTVDRSTDGVWFVPIAQVPAAGDAQQRIDYLHDDAEPPVGTVFYRLRQFDRDGTEHTGPVAVVVRSGTVALSAWAQDGQVHLRTAGDAVRWSLVDLLGRTLSAGGPSAEPVIGIPEGTALLVVEAGADRQVFRVVRAGGAAVVTPLR